MQSLDLIDLSGSKDGAQESIAGHTARPPEARGIAPSKSRRHRKPFSSQTLCLSSLVLAIAACAIATWHDPGGLRLVARSCAAAHRLFGTPLPCLEVRPRSGNQVGTIVLSTPFENHILLTPALDITGLESPRLRDPGSDIYWKAAWAARHFLLDQSHGLSNHKIIGLAANSQASRSQDQFHIHVDCVKAGLTKTLLAEDQQFGNSWNLLPFYVDGQRYYGRKIREEDLAQSSLIADLIFDNPAFAKSLSELTIALIGIPGSEGRARFYALAGLAYSPGEGAENVLDHSCTD